MSDRVVVIYITHQTGSATLLQYIGTPQGVMRGYPSYYTPRVGKWVTYDHRFRIWFVFVSSCHSTNFL